MTRAQFFAAIRQYAALSQRMNQSFGAQALVCFNAYTESIEGDGVEYQKQVDEARTALKSVWRTHRNDPQELVNLLSD